VPRSSNAIDFGSLRLTACTRADVTSYLRDWRYRRNGRSWGCEADFGAADQIAEQVDI
jgi:hypothetical protein